jgi:hypothetical protein
MINRAISITMIIIVLAIVILAATIVSAADWGTLTGRFVYDGKAPSPQPLSITKDQEVCSKAPQLVDEGLAVDDKGGLANVVIWVRTKSVEVNPDYAKNANDKIVLDNHHCRFDPHVLGMRDTQTLEIKNSDPMGHNTNLALIANAPFNVIIPAGSTSDKKIDGAEQLPATITCNIHPWMNQESAGREGFGIPSLARKIGPGGKGQGRRQRRRLEARPL